MTSSVVEDINAEREADGHPPLSARSAAAEYLIEAARALSLIDGGGDALIANPQLADELETSLKKFRNSCNLR